MIKFHKIISFQEDDLENEIITLLFLSDIEGDVIITVHSIKVIEQNGEPVFDLMYDCDRKLSPDEELEVEQQIYNIFIKVFEEALLDIEFEHVKEILTA